MNLIKSTSHLRMLWAVDLNGPDARLPTSVPKIIDYLAHKTDAIIEPVHVLRMLPELYGDFTARWLPEYCQSAEDRIEQLIKGLKLEKTTTPRIIFHDSSSTRGAVRALSERAARSGAGIIIAQTHGREGGERLISGSFAETLLSQSPVPVLLIHYDMDDFHDFRSILFPCDFGPGTRERFNRVLDLAQRFDSAITLFHSVHPSVEQAVNIRESVENELGAARRRATHWAGLARERGIRVSVIIDETGSNVADQILELARDRNFSLIAIESHSGPISAAPPGGIVRQVARHAPCPVLVLKPRATHALRAVKPVHEEEIRRAA